MTIVYDMASGNIQSEQEQAHSCTDYGATVSEIALQLVEEIKCDIAQDAASIHVIHALLERD